MALTYASVFCKSFENLTFGLVSWYSQGHVMFVPSFMPPWFKSVWAIGDSMHRDSFQKFLIQLMSKSCISSTLHRNHWLERYKGLQCCFEAYCPRKC